MVQDVMSHFVAHDKQGFWVVHFLNCSVPHDNSLGGADSSYIGVEFVGFLAGIHFEHPARRDGEPAAPGKLFDLAYQLRVALIERDEIVKERINDPGTAVNDQQENCIDREPKVEPPAPRTLPDNEDHEPQQEDSKDPAEACAFQLIAEPRSPALHRKPVLPADAMLVCV